MGDICSSFANQEVNRTLSTKEKIPSTILCNLTGVSDLVDLWVIKNKKPRILYACSTSRSREQSTKRRSCSENMWKVCLFFSQNKNIYDYQTWHEVRKGLWAFFLIVLSGCWLAGRANSDHTVVVVVKWRHHANVPLHRDCFSCIILRYWLSQCCVFARTRSARCPEVSFLSWRMGRTATPWSALSVRGSSASSAPKISEKTNGWRTVNSHTRTKALPMRHRAGFLTRMRPGTPRKRLSIFGSCTELRCS